MCKCCGGHGVQLKKETFAVEGMTCAHCKAAVEKAVRALPGCLAAEVDLSGKQLKIEYDAAKLSAEAIQKAIEDEGFSVPQA